MAGACGYIDRCTVKLNEYNTALTEGINRCHNVGVDCEGIEGVVDNLHHVMLEYARLQRDIEQCCEAARTSKLKLQDASSTCELEDLETVYEKTLENLQSKNTDEQLEKYKHVKDFMKTIGASEESTQESSNVDQDVEMTQDLTQKFICPITKVTLVEPMKNTVCSHTYSKQPIMAHIRQRKERAMCPVAGCRTSVAPDRLEEDKVTAFEMKRQKNNPL